MKSPYTNPLKWGQRWFVALPPLAKLGWLFILDHADAGGCYEHIPEMYEFATSKLVVDPVDIYGDEALVMIPGQIGRYFIPEHIQFQYYKLPAGSKVSEAIWHRWHKDGIMDIAREYLPDCYFPPAGYQEGRFEGPPMAQPKKGSQRTRKTTAAPRKKPAPLKKPAKFAKAAEMYEKLTGGAFPWGLGGSVLSPLYERFGEANTLAGLKLYVEQTEARFCSIGHFGRNPKAWIEKATGAEDDKPF